MSVRLTKSNFVFLNVQLICIYSKKQHLFRKATWLIIFTRPFANWTSRGIYQNSLGNLVNYFNGTINMYLSGKCFHFIETRKYPITIPVVYFTKIENFIELLPLLLYDCNYPASLLTLFAYLLKCSLTGLNYQLSPF